MPTIGSPLRMAAGSSRLATLATLTSAAALVACGGGDPDLPVRASRASVCFNASAYAVGSRSVLDYARSGPSGVGNDRIVSTVTNQTTDNGIAKFVQVSERFYSPDWGGAFADKTTSYNSGLTATGITTYKVDEVSNSSVSGGFVYSVNSGMTYNNPGWIDKTPLLQVGESYTVIVPGSAYAYAQYASTNSTSPLKSGNASTTQTVKFVGFESVTVPAGTFADACKFETTTTVARDWFSDVAETSTRWVTSGGSGVLVKEILAVSSPVIELNSQRTHELTSGTVNGAPVR